MTKSYTRNIIYFSSCSCGRSGQVDHALQLFRQMREDGIPADRVSYNSVFFALSAGHRRSRSNDASAARGRAQTAFDLWSEMLGRKQSQTDAIATARADKPIIPDIITVTDAIAALSSDSDTKEGREKIDRIFSEAVDYGIILSSDTLDSLWEVDLSGMSLPVARAACRFILRRVAASYNSGGDVQDLIFITGVGKGHFRQPSDEGISNTAINHTSSLREFVQGIVQTDFPPLISEVRAGTVQIDKNSIKAWAKGASKSES